MHASQPTEMVPPILHIPELVALPFVRHGFSTRACGNLATRYGPTQEIEANRRHFAELADIDGDHVAHFALTNSSRVGLVGLSDTVAINETPYRISIRGLLADATPSDVHFITPQGVPNQQGLDGLITTGVGVGLFMVVGDAAPLIIIARNGRGIGLAHVGLVGTVNRIIPNMIQSICQAAECAPDDLVVGIGPTVGPCCYALGTSVTWGQVVSPLFFKQFGAATAALIQREGQFFFDLPHAIRLLLQKTGVPSTSIHGMDLCTACPDSPFFPHHSGIAGRFGALVGLI